MPIMAASPIAIIPTLPTLPENASVRSTLRRISLPQTKSHKKSFPPGSLEPLNFASDDMNKKTTIQPSLKVEKSPLARDEAGASSGKRVSWREPLFDETFIPKEGRSQSVHEFRQQVNLIRQRHKRSKEISQMRSFFDESSDTSNDKRVTSLAAESPRQSSNESVSLQHRKSYDLSQPIFTFKQLNYEPTIPVLLTTSNPNSPVDELAELPTIHLILQKSLKDKRNHRRNVRQSKRFFHSNFSSDSSSSKLSSSAPMVNLSGRDTPHSSPRSEIDEKETFESPPPLELDNKIVHSSKSSSASLSSDVTEDDFDLTSKVDHKLCMRRNMLAKMPPFLRSYGSYGLLLTSKSDSSE